MANRHEVEGDIVMGWVDRKRPTGYTRKDMHGRVIYNRTPFSELQGLITPIDLRYIVAQLEMPDPVHPSDWKFSIEGSVERPITLTLEELQNMPGRTVRVVTEWRALCTEMGHTNLIKNPSFDGTMERIDNHDELDIIIGEWTQQQDKHELMHKLQQARVPASVISNARDLHFDPHLRARGLFEWIYPSEGRGIGNRLIIGRPWKFSKSAPKIRKVAPKYGEDNKYMLLNLLGISEKHFRELEEAGIVSNKPVTERIPVQPSIETLIRTGRISAQDPNYKTLLETFWNPSNVQ